MGIARSRGRGGEEIAAAYLELAGIRVRGHNQRLAGVEVDLLASDGRIQVIVEVKLRSRSDYGGAPHALGETQRLRLLRAAGALLQRGHDEVRVDVVAVELEPDGATLRHYRNALMR